MKKEILLYWFGDNEPVYAQWNVDNFKKMNPGWEVNASKMTSLQHCKQYIQSAEHACICCCISAFPISPFNDFMSMSHFNYGIVNEHSRILFSNIKCTLYFMLQVQKTADLHNSLEEDQSGIYISKDSKSLLLARAADFKNSKLEFYSSFCNNELSPIENLGEVK